MHLLNEVDKPGSDIDNYVTSLDKLLVDKMNKISEIRKKLGNLYVKLKDEEILSSKLAIVEEKDLNKSNNYFHQNSNAYLNSNNNNNDGFYKNKNNYNNSSVKINSTVDNNKTKDYIRKIDDNFEL